MTARRGRRSAARQRREARLKAAGVCGALVVLLLVVFWSRVWGYVAVSLAVAAAGGVGWWLWKTHRRLRHDDRTWRQEDAVRAGHRTFAEVDMMTGDEFEELVAELCRRDGCTEVRRVGGSGDNGADVTGRLPDGRTMVIQCKRYTPSSSISSPELRGLLGSKTHFKADVAIFVTTTRFTGPSVRFALDNDILAIHRDHLGLWNSGTPLAALSTVNGAGQGGRQHRARWKKTYGT